MEGYNTIHDIWRLLINSAVDIANRNFGCHVANYDFAIVGKPDSLPQDADSNLIRLELGDKVLERKLAAAREYKELAGEVEAAFQEFGPSSFGVECLRPVSTALEESFKDAKPFYETYGEKQMAAGFYEHVIRHREHIFPLAEALCKY